MTAKSFHLGDILSVTTDRLVSPRHIDGVYDILNWMTGDNLFTHQLSRANGECKGPLLAQHPDLAAVIVPDSFGDDPATGVGNWLAEQVARFGEYRDVTPLAGEEHARIDPFTEMRQVAPNAEIIPVVIGDED